MEEVSHRTAAAPPSPIERALPPPGVPSADAPPPPKIGWVSTFSLAPVVLAVLTAMFFMTGRAYWLAYLGHFNLEPTLFSDDLSNQATRSVSAWLYAFKEAGLWVRDHLAWAIGLVALPIAVILSLCIAAGLLRWIWRLFVTLFGELGSLAGRAARHPGTRSTLIFLRTWCAPPRFTDLVMRGIGAAYAVAYGLYIAFWTVGLVLILLVGPFNYVGDRVALRDQADGFASSPVVTLNDASGKATSYRLILCAPRYCALYDGKHAVAVAAAVVARAESPAPAPKNMQEKSPSVTTERIE